MAPWTGPPALLTAYLETRACEFLLSDAHPSGLTLPPNARDVILNAIPNATLIGIQDVRCGELVAAQLIEYAMVAALAFRTSNDARAEVCSRAENSLRAALARLKRTDRSAADGSL